MDSDSSALALRQCFHCKAWFPATLDYFQSNKSRKDGMSPRCKECLKLPQVPRYVPPEGKRRCSKCKSILPATADYFSANQKRPGGLSCKCKACDSKGWKRYAQVHRDHLHEGRRLAKQRNPESYRESQRKYAQSEHGRAARNAIGRNRRAHERQVKGSHTAEEERAQYDRQKGKCYYCGKKVAWGKHHVDHTFPIARIAGTDIPGNGIDYLVITCKPCNQKKNGRYPWEFFEGGRLL